MSNETLTHYDPIFTRYGCLLTTIQEVENGSMSEL